MARVKKYFRLEFGHDLENAIKGYQYWTEGQGAICEFYFDSVEGTWSVLEYWYSDE